MSELVNDWAESIEKRHRDRFNTTVTWPSGVGVATSEFHKLPMRDMPVGVPTWGTHGDGEIVLITRLQDAAAVGDVSVEGLTMRWVVLTSDGDATLIKDSDDDHAGAFIDDYYLADTVVF